MENVQIWKFFAVSGSLHHLWAFPSHLREAIPLVNRDGNKQLVSLGGLTFCGRSLVPANDLFPVSLTAPSCGRVFVFSQYPTEKYLLIMCEKNF